MLLAPLPSSAPNSSFVFETPPCAVLLTVLLPVPSCYHFSVMSTFPEPSDALDPAAETRPVQDDSFLRHDDGFLRSTTCVDELLVGGHVSAGRHDVAAAPSPCPSSESSAALLPSSRAARRVCTTSGCRRAVGSASNDPHTVCIVCRKGVCTVDNRCRNVQSGNPGWLSVLSNTSVLCSGSETIRPNGRSHSLLLALQGFLRPRGCPALLIALFKGLVCS